MSEGQRVVETNQPEIASAKQSKDERAERKQELKNALLGRTCFVVMPFGTKPILDSKISDDGKANFKNVDFNAVYNHLIQPCLDAEGFNSLRSDEETDSGMIHQQMIQRIIDSDLVIVDVSSLNPNVFYELGIRHTAQKSGTLIIRRDVENLPFNIAGMRAIDYPSFVTDKEWTTGGAKTEDARDKLRSAIIATLKPGLSDSPVHTLVPGLNISRPSKPLNYRFGVECDLNKFIDRNLSGSSQSIVGAVKLTPPEKLKEAAKHKRIGIIEGDLARIDCVDAWVNPENTRFEMARPHDQSISAIVRSQAANRGNLAFLRREDSLARRLKREAQRVGGEVETGAAIALPPFRLRQRNNLVAIVHVAAQTGMRGRGYQTTRNLEDCVENALDAVEIWNTSVWRRLRLRRPIRTILFPLFGSVNRDAEGEQVAERLIGTAAQYLALWPDGLLDKVYFLAFTDRDRAVCRSAFIRLGLAEAKVPADKK